MGSGSGERSRFRRASFRVSGGSGAVITVRPPHAEGTADLFRCANEALACGKREGGGRVAIYVEEKMVLKSNYYTRPALDRLSKLAGRLNRTEASLLREALDDLIQKLR